VEQPCELHADVDIIKVEVLPLGGALTQQRSQLVHLCPHVAATLLSLDLQEEGACIMYCGALRHKINVLADLSTVARVMCRLELLAEITL
jgi:hypothetical protein